MRRWICVLALLPLALEAAVGCPTRSIPAATLLLPHFRVARNGAQLGDIPEGGADTLVSLTNTGSTGLLVHVTVWSKYGRPVLGFNVPLLAKDVATFRMKDVLNGKLNVNPRVQNPLAWPNDPCGLNVATGAYGPAVGFGAARFVRFANPDARDARHAVSIYRSPAFTGAARLQVWDSLDESRALRSLLAEGQPGVLDADSPACGTGSDGVLAGDFTGSVTFDVVNYCTNAFPSDASFYTLDALATRGWEEAGHSPNALIGDVFHVDPDPVQGGVSGEPLVSLPFHRFLDWTRMPTFRARYAVLETPPLTKAGVPAAFRFVGDGRMPLGNEYAVRYLSDPAASERSWLQIYRTAAWSMPTGTSPDLCAWVESCRDGADDPACETFGPRSSRTSLAISVFDDDENTVVWGAGPGGWLPPSRFAFLESQSLDLLENLDFNPGRFRAGWAELWLGAAQGHVSVRHRWRGGESASVGGAVLRYPYRCGPILGVPARN